ncbi:retropepsin-like aspartic protease family protein [Parahaliea mediterranea]|uniref:retropepsin-like aspartic protease family protein n=1 Tax=Parahaliea mediterranea TaxID=651086 RepID=UPI000E2EE58C|nr:TIGR02281 family clan AA aspartic protease [Parahaliea mediterranea]
MTLPPDARQQKRMGLVMQALAWIVLMALLGAWFSGLLERQQNPNRPVNSQVIEGGVREVILKRNRQGHYVTSGRINGEAVVFMLDTGATGIAIPESVAEQLRLQPGQRLTTQTANGLATAFATRVDRVSVGDIALEDMPAAIVPGLGSGQVLLGMSFLKHLEFTQRGDTLTLRQYPPGS